MRSEAEGDGNIIEPMIVYAVSYALVLLLHNEETSTSRGWTNQNSHQRIIDIVLHSLFSLGWKGRRNGPWEE